MRQGTVLALILGIFVLAAQAQERSAQPPIFRSEASLVAVNVTATDRDGYVTNLQADDFAIFEDGVRQDIRFFESHAVPLDLILLIDTSSSMRDKMEVVHAAAVGFMGTLRPQDRGAIVTFGDTVQVAQGLTSEQETLEAAIRGTRAYGGTALHNALYISLKQFARAARAPGDVRRQAFAVLSDGEDTASLLSFEQVLDQARRSGVTIYTIQLKSDVEPPTARLARQASDSVFAMRRLAQETGGQAFTAEHVHALAGIYNGIAEELLSQYSLGYSPSDNRSDGRFRRILVRVVSRSDVSLRARSGYLAEGTTVAVAGPPGAR